jgi:hypothetical protein
MQRTLVRIGMAVLGAGLAAPAPAHDLWLVPKTFRPAPAAPVEVEARIGEVFPISMNGPNAGSLTRLALVTLAGSSEITGAAVKGKALAFASASPLAGTAAIVLENKPHFIDLAADQFKSYLLEEGLGPIQAERVRRGEAAKPGRESYSRHAKCLIRTAPGEGVAARPAGLELEIVPAMDPYDLAPGRPLPVTALFHGAPLAGLELRAHHEGSKPVRVTTDAAGNATLSLDRGGVWCIAAIHMLRCTDCPKADWRSYFATLTFELPAGP